MVLCDAASCRFVCTQRNVEGIWFLYLQGKKTVPERLYLSKLHVMTTGNTVICIQTGAKRFHS